MNIPEKSLFIKKSTLPGAGNGLFTLVDIQKGDRIVEYKGRRQPWKEVKHDDGRNKYLLRLNRTIAIDALAYKKALGRFANDARGLRRGNGQRNNAEYLTYGNHCFIEATRSIKNGEEIFVGYGSEFWVLEKMLQARRTKASRIWR